MAEVLQILKVQLQQHFVKDGIQHGDEDIDEEVLKRQKPYLDGERFSMAFFYILIAMGIGSYLSIFIDLCFYVLYNLSRGNTKKKPLIAVTIRGWHITYIPARSTNHAT